MKINKEEILQKSKSHISFVRKEIEKAILIREKGHEEKTKKLPKASSSELPVLQQLIHFDSTRKTELTKLHYAPYFVRCDVIFQDKKEKETLYFAKFNFSKKYI